MTNSDGILGQPAEQRRFRRLLLGWFDQHKRDLPWRANRDPYRVWLSEIMLQQTRVAAVVEHYGRFLRRFPTVQKLAAAREASVLAVWSGLGYYRRARMLHVAAKKIVRELGGEFPSSVEELQKLPGIGRYTAAAIASIAFDTPVAVVDGNVERVLLRVVGKLVSGEVMWQSAEILLDKKRPGDFNQAMMELGATVCLPQQPKCLLCPVNALCTTRGEHPQPARNGRQKKREIAVSLNTVDGSVFLVQRPTSLSLMPGMWELPELADPNGTKPLLTVRHSITVTNYIVQVIQNAPLGADSGEWIPKSRLTTLPLTGLARKILRRAQII